MDTFKVALMIITIIAAWTTLTTLTALTTLTKLTRVMEDEASSDLTICCKDKEIRWVDESVYPWWRDHQEWVFYCAVCIPDMTYTIPIRKWKCFFMFRLRKLILIVHSWKEDHSNRKWKCCFCSGCTSWSWWPGLQCSKQCSAQTWSKSLGEWLR